MFFILAMVSDYGAEIFSYWVPSYRQLFFSSEFECNNIGECLLHLSDGKVSICLAAIFLAYHLYDIGAFI
jgi:hypothetical protein